MTMPGSWRSLSQRARRNPSSPGRPTSRMTTSAGASARRPRSSAPSAAPRTRWPSMRSASASIRQSLGSSSTTMISAMILPHRQDGNPAVPYSTPETRASLGGERLKQAGRHHRRPEPHGPRPRWWRPPHVSDQAPAPRRAATGPGSSLAGPLDGPPGVTGPADRERPAAAPARPARPPGRHCAFPLAALRRWLGAVRDGLARRRTREARLAAGEARFRAAAESLRDGLAIFDAEDRLVYHNARYPENLTEGLRATLALGKRWTGWWREAAALGPVFHPEMGGDYLERRLAEREEPLLDREHRLADGRWIRVREGRMPDGGRVVVTADV